MRKSLKNLLLAAVLAIAGAGSAFASLVSFDIEWSGASFGNNASATGFITFDNALVPDVGFQSWHSLPSGAVTDLGITITGSVAGNGTFDLGDFSAFYFATRGALDFSTELIGQLMDNGCPFGTSTGACGSGSGGDFNLFGSTPGAPNGTWYFRLTTAGGDAMLVTSMAPSGAVPEPGSVALVGIALLGLVMRRRHSA